MQKVKRIVLTNKLHIYLVGYNTKTLLPDAVK